MLKYKDVSSFLNMLCARNHTQNKRPNGGPAHFTLGGPGVTLCH